MSEESDRRESISQMIAMAAVNVTFFCLFKKAGVPSVEESCPLSGVGTPRGEPACHEPVCQ